MFRKRFDFKRIKWNWKTLFLSLAGINVCLLLIFLIFIIWPVSEGGASITELFEEELGSEFTIQSSKQNLNDLVNTYIDKRFKDTDDKYSINMNENVHFTGSIEAFKTDIPVSIILEPSVEENGDLVLYPTEMSLGLLQLPQQKILEYVKKELKTPDWIEIDPKKQRIYIAVTQIKMKNNINVKVQHFDLKQDKISFWIKIPNETLGF